ncbi:MAG: hypothetical protein RIR14_1825, partial [Pseudomonadota bacterium]
RKAAMACRISSRASSAMAEEARRAFLKG